jgi:hypothetical protein
LAKTLIARRPFPAEPLSILAYAAANNGEGELAAQALNLAAQRGWRDPLVQIVVAQQAAQQGQWDLAFQRTIALWQTGNRGPEILASLAAIAQHPKGREAMAIWAISRPQSSREFLTFAAGSLDGDDFEAIVAQAEQQGAGFNCHGLAQAAQAMLGQGHAQGVGVWPARCQRDHRNENPLAWRSSGASDVTAGNEGSVTITYATSGPGFVNVATTLAVLKPGPHAVSASVQSGSGLLPQLSTACIGSDGKSGMRSTIMLASDSDTVNIPSADCAVQRLTVSAPSGSGTIRQLTITPF